MFECEFCKNKFKTISSLMKHQRVAKYCSKIRFGDEYIEIKNSRFKCEDCDKTYTSKENFSKHQKNCLSRQLRLQREKYEKKIEDLSPQLRLQLEKYEKKIEDLSTQLRLQREKYEKKIEDLNKIIKSPKEYEDKFMDLLYSYQNLAEIYVKDGKDNINKLNKKYLKRHKRTKYPGENVIYILTTSSLKKDRRYILGKAVNLTKRLSTYNKSDEHEVIFYASCPNKEKMSLVESMVFDKLCKCRERANRERFILPGDEDINLFSETIKDCINFVS
jgi:hypothetical protein